MLLTKSIIFALTRIALLVMALSLNTSGATSATPASTFIPITPENVTQLRPLASVAQLRNGSLLTVFSPDEREVIVSAFAAPPKYLNLETGEERLLGLGDLYKIKWNPKGHSFVATAGFTPESHLGPTLLIDAPAGDHIEVAPSKNDLAEFSPNGDFLVTGAGVGAIQVWDLLNRQVVATIDNYTRFERVTFSPDGKYLAWLDFQRLVLWDIQKRAEAYSLPIKAPYLFTPDASKIITYQVNAFQLWDTNTGNLLATVDGGFPDLYNGGIYTLGTPRPYYWTALISADGHDLVLQTGGSEPGSSFIQRWDVSNLASISKVWQVNGGSDEITLSPDNSTIIRRKISNYQLLNLRTGQVVSFGDNQLVPGVSFGGNGLVMTTGTDNRLHFWKWNGESMTEIWSLPGRIANFSPSGTTLVNQAGSGILFYGVPTETRPARPFVVFATTRRTQRPIFSQASGSSTILTTLSTQGEALLIAGRRGDFVYVLDYGGWMRASDVKLMAEVDASIDMLPVLDTPESMAALATPTPIPPTAIAVPTKQAVSALTAPPSTNPPVVQAPSPEIPKPPADLVPITSTSIDQVRLLAALPGQLYFRSGRPDLSKRMGEQGRKLIVITNGEKSSISVYDLVTLERKEGFLSPHEFQNEAIAVDPYGHYFMYQDVLWDLDSVTEVGRFGVGWQSEPLGFTPDGELLYYIPEMGFAYVDVSTRSLIRSLPIPLLRLSPDWRIGVEVLQNVLRMYDLGAGKIVSRLQAHQHDIQNMVFSPDGKLLASYDGQEVIIWDLTTRSKLASFVLQREYTFSDSQVVTFTPDSRRLVTLDDTHQLRLRQADTGAVVAELGPANPYSRLIFSPDGSLLVVSDPLRIIKLATGEVQPLGYGFDGNWLHFSPDGATLVVGDYFTASTLVFGIPTQVRPIQWQPTKAHIRPSSINVRSAPDENAPVIAQASGDVQVAGQNLDFVYLPEFKGWVLSDKQYLDLGSDVTTVTLPFISSPEDWTKLQAAAQQTSATSVPASPTPVPSATLPTVSSCMVTTRFGVNLRTGPGQGYDKAGSAPAGQALTATKQTKGADGFTWWQLDTGEWVREDLVLEAADCTALPSQ